MSKYDIEAAKSVIPDNRHVSDEELAGAARELVDELRKLLVERGWAPIEKQILGYGSAGLMKGPDLWSIGFDGKKVGLFKNSTGRGALPVLYDFDRKCMVGTKGEDGLVAVAKALFGALG